MAHISGELFVNRYSGLNVDMYNMYRTNFDSNNNKTNIHDVDEEKDATPTSIPIKYLIKIPTTYGDTTYGDNDKPSDDTPVVSQKESSQKRIVKKDKKFVIGGIYYIYPFSNRRLKRTYILKKYIYTINDEEVRAVIMKQIAGSTMGKKYTLNRTDCLMLHLKYEPGLEVFSMDLDWKLKNNKQKDGNK